MARIAIIGSREYPRLDDVRRYVKSLPEDTVIVTGGAIGVDAIAEDEAQKLGLEIIVHKPNYLKYGNRAPLERNKLIEQDGEFVVAFHDGVSTGTLHCVGLFRKSNKSVFIRTANAVVKK